MCIKQLRWPRIFVIFLCLFGMLFLCCSCGDEVSVPKDTTTSSQTFTESEPVFSGEAENNTENFENITTYRVTDMEGEEGLDFIIDFPAGKDLTILQIADTQIIDLGGVRNELRGLQLGEVCFSTLPDLLEFRIWRYMDEAVEKSTPDLIVLTGDNIYGETDDSGELWLALIEKMDSYGIPWCAVFGNHDNESGKGVQWQVEQLMASQYCIFRQGTVSGNSNYNLLIRQGGEAKFLFYMMDSNGCTTIPNNPGEGIMPDNVDIDKIRQTAGFSNNQVTWMGVSANSIHKTYGEVPVLAFYHILGTDAAQRIKNIYPSTWSSLPFSPDLKGDFGEAKEVIGGAETGRFWKIAKAIGCTGIFVGHQHKVATSIVCDGIRVTYGLKTGTYAYHDEELLGSTKITLAENGGTFEVEYIYSELPYEWTGLPDLG